MSLIAGVELGGTKIVCTLASGPERIVAQETVPTTFPDETLGACHAILARWHEAHGFTAFGIASFGPIDLDPASPTYGHMTNTAKQRWIGADIVGNLSRGFDVPVAFDTDVNGAAFAEMRWGAGQGLSDLAYVTVGTGIGVGLIVNGQATRGIQHSELGHIRIPRVRGDDWPGACPYHGDCVEGLASGSAIVARLGDVDVSTVGPEDPIWDTVVHAIAQLCHNMVVTTGPLRILVGGGVIQRQPHLLPRIEPQLIESLAGYMPLPTPYVTEPGLGDLAGPLGPIAMALSAD